MDGLKEGSVLFREHLPCARQCWPLAHIIVFNSHHNPVKLVLLLSPFYTFVD